MTTLETLNFDNLALRSLPVDPEHDNTTRQVVMILISSFNIGPKKRCVVLGNPFGPIFDDSGYPHNGRADKNTYLHDRRADKDS